MDIAAEHRADYESLPAPLRALLDAELAAGNRIAEVFHTHPAPPAGACFVLAGPVRSRPRESSEGISFYDRNSSHHSGEFADPTRFYFILEPPNPPPPEPDMNAIRAQLDAAARASAFADRDGTRGTGTRTEAVPERMRPRPEPVTRVERFRASMVLDYEKWREGIGYDLTQFEGATKAELDDMVRVLLPPNGWREVEALAKADTPTARQALRAAARSGNAEVRAAIEQHAPHLLGVRQRAASLVRALKDAGHFGGLSATLDSVAEFHPKPVMDALFLGCLEREHDIAPGFAALLLFIHGKATERHAMELRPFWIRFNTVDPAERQAVFEELCQRIGADPGPWLKKSRPFQIMKARGRLD